MNENDDDVPTRFRNDLKIYRFPQVVFAHHLMSVVKLKIK